MSVQKKSGIYSITNLVTGKFYIGSAVDIGNRWAVHRLSLRKGRSGCGKLQNTWNKHGEASFVFEVIEFVKDKNKLIEKEQMYLDLLEPAYNIRKIADSCLGVKHTEQNRRKRSERMKGAGNPLFGVTGPDNPLFGRTQPGHLKALWSEQRKGSRNPMHGVTPKHAKLKSEDVRLIRLLISMGLKNKEIAEHFGVTSTNISHIKHGHGYRGVGL